MQNWKFAISSILGHKMRSFLTMIGIIIGVASVVVIMALGTGLQRGVTKNITKDQEYVPLLYSPKKSNHITGANLTGEEGSSDDENPVVPPTIQESWVKQLLKVDGVKGYYVTNSATSTFSYLNKKADKVNITGVNATFFKIRKYKVIAGRSITTADYKSFSRVVMLDEILANKLFGESSKALNQIISVGEDSYRVVGVYKDPNAGRAIGTANGNALMANTQLASEFDTDEITAVYVYIPDIERIKEVGVNAARMLTTISGVRQGEYQILNMDSLLGQLKNVTGMVTGVIGAIAGISLLVGGVGVMNIMLVSVTERTREIGLRKALGATRGNILTQFLIESMVLTLIGGLIGLSLAFTINVLIGAVVPENVLGGPPIISVGSAIGSLLFSAMVGIVFGILPANKASKLDPIEALRYE